MKIVRSLIVIFTLFIGLPSVAMECGLCLEPISVEHPSIAMCPNKNCANARPTHKNCWLEYCREDRQCLYGCESKLAAIDSVHDINRSHMSTCVVCDKNFIGVLHNKEDKTRFCSLDCSHFICYTCIKDKDAYVCSKCDQNHNLDAIKKIKAPRNSGEAKKALSAYVLKHNKKQNSVKKPVKQIIHENCPICHQDKDVARFFSIGCSVNHRYCIDCLPRVLTHYDNCLGCNEPITKLQRIDLLARLNGDLLVPSHKIFALGALSVAVLPWIAHYWSKYRLQLKLYALNSAASVNKDMLLSFEFDCDGDGAAFLGLQESFDIARILQGINTEKQRTALQTAIEHYDVALRNAYDRIVSTYYYQPAANFAQKEPQLVQELNACTEQINQLVIDYIQEMGNPMRNMFLGIGVGVLSGIGILQITKG